MAHFYRWNKQTLKTVGRAALLAVLFGSAACDKLDPGEGPVDPAPSDAGVDPDLSKKDATPSSQAGNLVIVSKTAPLGKIAVGGRYELSWQLDAQTTYDDTYRFSVSGIDVKGASVSEWQKGIVAPVETEVRIYNPVVVKATVTVPAGAQSAKLVLRAESSGGRVVNNSSPLLLAVGEVAQVSDPRAFYTMYPSSFTKMLRSANIRIDGTPVDGLQVAFGQGGKIILHLLTDGMIAGSGGSFSFSTEIEGSPADWGAVLDLDHIDGIPDGQDVPLSVTLDNKIQNGSTTPSYLVVRAAHRVSPGAPASDYTSLIRIPIQGYAP